MAVRDEELCGKNFSELQNWIHQLSPLINYLINFPKNLHEKLGIILKATESAELSSAQFIFISL